MGSRKRPGKWTPREGGERSGAKEASHGKGVVAGPSDALPCMHAPVWKVMGLVQVRYNAIRWLLPHCKGIASYMWMMQATQGASSSPLGMKWNGRPCLMAIDRGHSNAARRICLHTIGLCTKNGRVTGMDTVPTLIEAMYVLESLVVNRPVWFHPCSCNSVTSTWKICNTETSHCLT